jgi:hypothetical protein
MTHDGRSRAVEFVGGPASGTLLQALAPTDTVRLADDSFFNQLAVPFDSLGTYIRFNLEVSETTGSPSPVPPDAVAFLLINSASGAAIPSADPFGSNALFGATVTGMSGGELEVFSPMSFVAPDTLVLGADFTAVEPNMPAGGRLRILEFGPIPSRRDITLRFEVPDPGGAVRLRVYDISGRLLSDDGDRALTPGVHRISWNGRDDTGRLAPAGVYLLRLDLGGQTLVRRAIVRR